MERLNADSMSPYLNSVENTWDRERSTEELLDFIDRRHRTLADFDDLFA